MTAARNSTAISERHKWLAADAFSSMPARSMLPQHARTDLHREREQYPTCLTNSRPMSREPPTMSHTGSQLIRDDTLTVHSCSTDAGDLQLQPGRESVECTLLHKESRFVLRMIGFTPLGNRDKCVAAPLREVEVRMSHSQHSWFYTPLSTSDRPFDCIATGVGPQIARCLLIRGHNPPWRVAPRGSGDGA